MSQHHDVFRHCWKLSWYRAVLESLWFSMMLLEELRIDFKRKPVVFRDNKGTIDTIIHQGIRPHTLTRKVDHP